MGWDDDRDFDRESHNAALDQVLARIDPLVTRWRSIANEKRHGLIASRVEAARYDALVFAFTEFAEWVRETKR